MTLIDNMSDMVDREDTSGMHGSLHHLQPRYITVDQMLGPVCRRRENSSR